MGRKPSYTAEQFVKAIQGTGGIITRIAANVAKMTGGTCDWNTARKYIDTYPSVQKAYQMEREGVIDAVEGTLITEAKKGEAWATKYYLGTQARHRGYGDRSEIEHLGKLGIEIIEVIKND